MRNLGDVFGDDAVVVWYGRFGSMRKSCIERKGFDVGYQDHSLVINYGSVIRASHEIKEGLRWDGWDKYYVCRDMDTARKLLSEVRTDEFWDKYDENEKSKMKR